MARHRVAVGQDEFDAEMAQGTALPVDLDPITVYSGTNP